jgi:hypothetical protein
MKTILVAMGLGCAAIAFTPALAQDVPPADPNMAPDAAAVPDGAAPPANPANPRARIENRQAVQEQKIDQGVATGDLTHHEARKLDKQQDKIADKEEDMRAENGGYLTHHDRKVLHKKQRDAGRDINRATTNDAVR